MIEQDSKINSDILAKEIYIYSLGCSKNLVDGENMSTLCRQAGFPITQDPETAQIIVVNTCGFIAPAKEESIQAILAMADYKEEGHCELLIVTGCLAERYADQIQIEMPEIDKVLGVRNYKDIILAIQSFYSDKPDQPSQYLSQNRKDALAHLRSDHIPSTPYYAYLKIAEGCSNHCSFCAIPGIRGPYQSRPMEDILEEAAHLAAQGYNEIIVVAQDTGFYGLDLYHRRKLPDLLEQLAQIPGLTWIRVLYLYAEGLTPDLLAVYQKHDNLIPYFDIPIQHASDKVLKRMNRRETQASLKAAFQMIREALPQASLRTTVMVGFPGETEEDFAQLLSFIKEENFDMLGCFQFSPEEDTGAFSMSEQIPEDIKVERYEKLMETQQEISRKHLQSFVGQSLQVKLESVADNGIYYVGRSAWQNPEVDSAILVLNTTPDEPILGEIVTVQVIEADHYELTGVIK